MSIDWVPDACSLPTAEQSFRVAEFDELFAKHLRGANRLGPSTLELTLAAESRATAAELTARENECCSFFEFDLAEVADAVRLRISVPAAYVAVLDGLADRLPA
jgi:hypothetical protein